MYRYLQFFLKGAAILFLLWAIGLVLFFRSIPREVTDTQTPTEAIVVLTGGRERLKTGFQLLCAQRAKVLFISGVNPEETFKSLLKTIDLHRMNCLLDKDQLVASTHLGYVAKNTKENAQETAAWLKSMEITSIRLVTAAYHMPRSLLQLKYLLPEVTIIPHSVFPFGKERYWWWSESALHMVLSEYHKLMWGYVRIFFWPQEKDYE